MTAASGDRSLTILHGSLSLGGIEQLLVRVSEVLAARGWRIQFVLQSRVDNVLDARAAAVGPVHLLPSDYRDAWPRVRRLTLDPTSYVFAPTSDAYLLAHLLRQRALHGARIVAGVYFPLEYANRSSHRVYDIGLAARLLASAPETNVLFMNEACRRAHVTALGRPFAASPIIPVPLVVPASARTSGRPAGRRLVSIGRLVDFKAYPLGAFQAMAELADEGRPFSYDIYGEGPLKQELQAAVQRHQLGHVVTFHGEVSPDRFGEVCSDALAFLGMGTAAVEAAGMGVPTMLAAVDERGPQVHGWFSQVAGFAVGEVEPGDVMRSMTDLLREVDDADDEAYAALALSEQRRAQTFGLDAVVDAFEAALLAAEPESRRLRTSDLVRGWLDRASDSPRLHGGRPSQRSRRYEPS